MPDYEKIFEAVTRDSRYLRNLDWGEPRSGHPEGTIRAHIAELERNLEALKPKLSEPEYWKLRILVHTHDTFKPEAKERAPISAPNSHASVARRFLEEFCDDADLLAMVQNHDVPYALWLQQRARGSFNEKRFAKLVATISDWNVFLAFMIVDGYTSGKSRAPLEWLFGQVAGKVKTRFGAADIL